MQQIIIAGHLGADPEERQTPNGQKVWNLRVATKVRKGGQDVTLWWTVTVWGDQFDRMMQHFKKGSAIMVNGDFMPPRTWVDNNSGETRVGLELNARNLMFAPFGRQEANGSGGGQGGFNQGGQGGFNQGAQGGYNQASAPQQHAAPQDAGFGGGSFGGGGDFAGTGAHTQTGMGADDGNTDDNLPF